MSLTETSKRVTVPISLDQDLLNILKNTTYYGKVIDPSRMINAILRHYLAGIAGI